MKLQLFAALVLALAGGVRAAAPQARTVSTNAPGATNNVVITCEAGSVITTNKAIFQKDVKARDPQMYLECQLLTVWSKPKTTNAPVPVAPKSETSLDSSDIERIVAETNVMMITEQIQVIGDRAVYEAAEDVLTFTGELVVALTAQGSMVGTNIVFNRRLGQMSMDGPITSIIYDSLIRSNSPPPAPKPK